MPLRGRVAGDQALPEDKEEAAAGTALPKRETPLFLINHFFLGIN